MVLPVRVLGLTVTNRLTSLTANATDAELVGATHHLLRLLALQYAGWFLLLVPVGLWRGRE